MKKTIVINEMTSETSQKPMATLAVAISGAIVPTMSHAEEEVSELMGIEVTETLDADENPYAVKGAPYLVEGVSDPRRMRGLAKTPATINVLTGTFIEESGDTDLKDILDAQPGITLGTGENGNAFGDRYVIRGHEARSDVFVDGMRDPGMTIRESFASEQVEISKGPSSTFAGRGTTGGAVNSVSKRASVEHDFTKISAGIGTDNMHRLTLDTNLPVNDDVAVRINALHAEEDVPERAPANRKRMGLAGSVIYDPTDELSVTFDWYHMQGDDKPDLGTYMETKADQTLGKPLSRDDVPPYLQDEDFLQSKVNVATLRVGYIFDPDTQLINLTRYGTTENGYVVTGALSSARTGDLSRYTNEEDAELKTNGFDSLVMSTHQGWQEVSYFANQTNYLSAEELAGQLHELVFGLEVSRYQIKNGQYTTSAEGTTNCWEHTQQAAIQSHCGNDANGNFVSNLNSLLQRDIEKGTWDSNWQLNMLSLSVMDTVELSYEASLFAGVRYDYYDYTIEAKKLAKNNLQLLSEESHSFEKGVWNGHFGLGYDLTPNLNVYAMYSTASNLNGGESDVGTDGGYGGYVKGGKDEKVTSYELGSKWESDDGRLLATLAAFRIVKDDVVEAEHYSSASDGNPNTGKNQVQGIEFGLSGNVTDRFGIQAGVALMASEVLESKEPDNVGKKLANFAEQSAMLQARYQVTTQFSVGGSATYEGERYIGQPDKAADESAELPAYTVYDAFAYYYYSKDLSVRLNVNNVFDREYHTAGYRNGSFVYLGDARNTQITVSYKF